MEIWKPSSGGVNQPVVATWHSLTRQHRYVSKEVHFGRVAQATGTKLDSQQAGVARRLGDTPGEVNSELLSMKIGCFAVGKALASNSVHGTPCCTMTRFPCQVLWHWKSAMGDMEVATERVRLFRFECGSLGTTLSETCAEASDCALVGAN